MREWEGKVQPYFGKQINPVTKGGKQRETFETTALEEVALSHGKTKKAKKKGVGDHVGNLAKGATALVTLLTREGNEIHQATSGVEGVKRGVYDEGPLISHNPRHENRRKVRSTLICRRIKKLERPTTKKQEGLGR